MKNALIDIKEGIPIYSAKGLSDEEFAALMNKIVKLYPKYRVRDLEESHYNIFYEITEKNKSCKSES